MALEIKKILYATDLSKNSAYAFRYAIDLSKNHHADIYLLHVIQRLSPASEAIVEDYLPEKNSAHHKTIIAGAIDRTKKKIAAFLDRELSDNSEAITKQTSIDVVEGYPVNEILDKAKKLNCDVIVMGTHGRGLLTHALLGSVSERVLRRVHIPVIIVPLPEGETEASLPDF